MRPFPGSPPSRLSFPLFAPCPCPPGCRIVGKPPRRARFRRRPMSIPGIRRWCQRIVALAALFALAIPAEAGIKNRLEIGSVLVEVTQGSPATLVGLATTANQGLEKTITYQIPKLGPADISVVIPLFLLNADIDDSNNRAVARGIDTLLFLTNTNPLGGAVVVVQITFRAGSGAALNNPAVFTIAPGQTAVVSAISTLNP